MKLWLLLLFAHRYPVEGIVVETHPGEIVVAHRPIENYMPAMTMPFHVPPSTELSSFTPGTRISFELRVSKHSSVAQNIQIREPAPLTGVILPKTLVKKLVIGDKFPPFSLTDQSGHAISVSDFTGKVVALDFIYTRCPLPDVCPRLSAAFSSVSKKLPDVEFLSITIDPQYDTPAVLADYARRWNASPSWHFLTGTPEQIQEVAGRFGLVYWPEEGSITHTVATAIIGRDGTLRARIDGANYRPDQLRALIERALQ